MGLSEGILLAYKHKCSMASAGIFPCIAPTHTLTSPVARAAAEQYLMQYSALVLLTSQPCPLRPGPQDCAQHSPQAETLLVNATAPPCHMNMLHPKEAPWQLLLQSEQEVAPICDQSVGLPPLRRAQVGHEMVGE